MGSLVLFNKPFGVLSQFSDADGRPGLKRYLPMPDVYPAGRLDADSEGLLILTASGALQARIANPRHKLPKTYWVQVEGQAADADLEPLRHGIDLGDFVTLPAAARVMAEPAGLWARDPPIRVRASIPTSWIEITLREGKNRQIRRMTARIALPTLRLIRYSIGHWTLDGLAPGAWRNLSEPAPA